ncbi:MAG: hypothetical protein HY352_02380 [Candidatus Omnitrophica bacterium]|nr:hypothetical protein [Candidatus Omnitrophota bacterium]
MNLRPELSQRLQQHLQAFTEGFRHNLALLGPQGSGKTYQLQHLLTHPPSGVLIISCPLYRESCGSFLQRFVCAILQAMLPDAAPVRGGALRSLEPLAQQIEGSSPRLAMAIRSIEGLLTRRQYGEAFTRTLDLIPIVSQERGMSCVLILDEFLLLEELGLTHAFHELGKRVMTWPTTLFILSSSSLYRARMILRERLQLLFGQFELLTLEALDAPTVMAWMQQELRGIRRPKGMTNFLMDWLGAYPWYLTVFVNRLKERATLSNSVELHEALFLQAAWDVVGSAEGALHQTCLARTGHLATRGRGGSRALEALLQVANGARTATEIGKRIGRSGLTDALQLLVEQDLAQRNGMCWIVTDPLLRCWLSTVLASQWCDARTDAPATRQRFNQALRGLWNEWVRAHQLSFSEQIAGLFAKFSDDTVSLDLKTGRLPRFQTIHRAKPVEDRSMEPYLVADAEGKRWCVTVQETGVDEQAIARFDAFCRAQAPKPSRKVVITKTPMDANARLLAKTANMWVWGPDDLSLLLELYGRA